MKTITTLALPMIVALAAPAWAADPEVRTKDNKDPRFRAALLKDRGPMVGNQSQMPRWVPPKSMREEFAKDAKLIYLEARLESYLDGGLVISVPTVKSKSTISGDPVPADLVIPPRALRRFQIHSSAKLSLAKIRSQVGKEVRLTIKVDKNGVPFIMNMSRPK